MVGSLYIGMFKLVHGTLHFEELWRMRNLDIYGLFWVNFLLLLLVENSRTWSLDPLGTFSVSSLFDILKSVGEGAWQVLMEVQMSQKNQHSFVGYARRFLPKCCKEKYLSSPFCLQFVLYVSWLFLLCSKSSGYSILRWGTMSCIYLLFSHWIPKLILFVHKCGEGNYFWVMDEK